MKRIFLLSLGFFSVLFFQGAARAEEATPLPDASEATASMPTDASPSVAVKNGVKLGALYLENDRQTGISKARGDVKLIFRDMEITTEDLSYDQRNKRAWTDSPFKLVQAKDGKTQVITGKKLNYSFADEVASVKDATLTMPAKAPGQTIYVSGKELKSIHRSKFVIKDGVFTTCSLVNDEKIPHYHMMSANMEIIPDVSLTGWATTFLVNNRPVLYLPYYWIPLNKLENNLDLGQNDIEGRYLKTRLGYALSPYQSGTFYNNFMEYKGWGTGFDHTWKADPNSQSVLTFYGLANPDRDDYDYADPTNASSNWVKYGLTGTPFQDHLFKVQHQQNLLGPLRLDLKYEDMNMYSFTNLPKNVPAGTDRRSFAAQLREVYTSHDLKLNDNRGGVDYSLGRSFKEARSNGTVSTNHTGRFSTTLGGVKAEGNTNWNQTKAWTPLLPGVTAAKSDPRTDWTNSLTFSNTIEAGPSTTLSLNHWRKDYPNTILDEELDPTLTVRQSLGWGNATFTAQKRIDFSPNALKADTIRSRGYKDKLPELIVESNSIGENFQPFKLSMGLGRYFESGSYTPEDPAKSYTTSPINRFNPEFTLVNKPLDVKLGKLDFGGTGVKQFFYSTGDSQYSLNMNSGLASDWGDHLSTTFNYTKVKTDPNNNSPLKSDSLGLQKSTLLTSNVVVKGTKDASGNADLNWTTSSGYDYERQRYLNMNTSLNYAPSKRLNLQMQSGYTFENVPQLSLKNGTWSPVGMTFNLRSTDGTFGGVFGQENLIPGWECNNTLSYDFAKGQWGSLQNNLTIALGEAWQQHWEFKLTGSYDYGGVINGISTEKGYHLNEISLNRDLHDFLLAFSYNRQAQAYMLRLTMIAFGTDIFNFNKSGFTSSQ